MGGGYYADKLDSLRAIFGSAKVEVSAHELRVDNVSYPILDDVVILIDPAYYPASVRRRLGVDPKGPVVELGPFAEGVQRSFGKEWQTFADILPEHEQEFIQYFDLVDLESLRDARVCDLGCGSGRWSYLLRERCRELVLVDFSEAIFVARRNLRGSDSALFFMADLTRLPFASDFADFLFCLGVLHHLPTNALAELRQLRKSAPRILAYLYYALDNRPAYFRCLLTIVSYLRRVVSRVKANWFRTVFTNAVALAVYVPLIRAGGVLARWTDESKVPLYETYRSKSLQRIRQDVYDRFFTQIEQRFSRTEILGLADSFERVTVSENAPYWHFLCVR